MLINKNNGFYHHRLEDYFTYVFKYTAPGRKCTYVFQKQLNISNSNTETSQSTKKIFSKNQILTWRLDCDTSNKYSFYDIHNALENYYLEKSGKDYENSALLPLWRFFFPYESKTIFLILTAFREIRNNSFKLFKRYRLLSPEKINFRKQSCPQNNDAYYWLISPPKLKLFTKDDIATAFANLYFSYFCEDYILEYPFPQLWSHQDLENISFFKYPQTLDSYFKVFNQTDIKKAHTEIKKTIYKIHSNDKKGTCVSNQVLRQIWMQALISLNERLIHDFPFSGSDWIKEVFPNADRKRNYILFIHDLCPNRLNFDNLLPVETNYKISSDVMSSPLVRYLPFILYSYITTDSTDNLTSIIDEFTKATSSSENYRRHHSFIERTFIKKISCKKILHSDFHFLVLLFRCCIEACIKTSIFKYINLLESFHLFANSFSSSSKINTKELIDENYVYLNHPKFVSYCYDILCDITYEA